MNNIIPVESQATFININNVRTSTSIFALSTASLSNSIARVGELNIISVLKINGSTSRLVGELDSDLQAVLGV